MPNARSYNQLCVLIGAEDVLSLVSLWVYFPIQRHSSQLTEATSGNGRSACSKLHGYFLITRKLPDIITLSFTFLSNGYCDVPAMSDKRELSHFCFI